MFDGEVVVLDKDGVSDFDALRSGKHNTRAQLYAFDMLVATVRITAANCAASFGWNLASTRMYRR